ncbi:MAG: ABC transporter ATP-binding protein/permease [Bacilli bacterium]|nr:ABC transporter ATP-binding protein/permease [Bacilli bacterium]
MLISLLLAALSSVMSIVSPGMLSKLTDTISSGIGVNSTNMTTIVTKINNPIDNSKILFDESLLIYDRTEYGEYLDNNTTFNYEAFKRLPNSIKEYIYPSFEIDGVVITTDDQIELKKIFETVDQTNSEAMLKAFDSAPESVKKVILPTIDFKKVLTYGSILIMLLIVSAFFNYLTSIITAIVSNKSARDLRNRISYKINKLPLVYFDNNQVGDVLSRVTNDVDTVAQSLNNSLATLVSSLTLFIGAIIMMFATNVLMTLAAIFSTIIGFVFMIIILGKSQKYFIQRQEELGKLNSHIEEVYSGLLVVKAYNGKETSDKEFDELNEGVYKANMMSQFLSGLMQPLMGFVGNFGYVAVCIVGALLTLKGSISFGVIVAFMIYVRLFTNPLSQIAQAFTSLQSTAAAGERVFELLDENEMDDESNIKNKLALKNAKGNIEFKNVKFGYTDDKVIIKDFSASAKPGSKIAIVGPTGAGKTTIVNLLMKFYNIDEGDIIIDGISIKDLSRENIHNLFTMVLQDTWLFNGTIKDNIRFNREKITDEEINKVLDTVGLKHFIATLSNGIDTEITENDSISSGQKQLLTIARGMLEDAPFLILDEATSNVDTRTEELVQQAMDKLMVGRTSFIIAHRLSTIKNADLILVMDEGNIVEMGTHNELLKQKGFYANLYNSQFKL